MTTRTIVQLLVLALAAPVPAQGLPLHVQDFETSAAPWTHTNGQAFPYGWDRQPSAIHPGWAPPGPGGWCLWIDSDATGEIGTSDFAVSPPIATTGYQPLRVSWGIGYDDFYNPGVDRCQMQYRTSADSAWGGWMTGRDYQTDAVGLDSIEIAGPCDSIQLRFYYTDGEVMPCAWAAIDNVVVSGTVTGVAGGPGASAWAGGLLLRPNWPNPMKQWTTIRYQLPTTGEVSLNVYNVAGQVVRTLVDGAQPAGSHAARWDGRDGQGRKVRSGIYFYRLMTGSGIATRKMTVIR